MNVVFFGTPLFAAQVLSFLVNHQVQVTAIVTRPDRPQGRTSAPCFSAVKQISRTQFPNIPLYQPNKTSDFQFEKQIKAHKADLFIVAAYGEIIGKHLLTIPKLSCLNIHPSLLPKYRGAAPIHFALLNGDRQSGTTIIEMAPKMDAGAILKQTTVSIPPEMNFQTLENHLCQVSCRDILTVIQAFEKGDVQKIPQDHSKATYVKKINPSMACLDWHQPATVLHNQIRAFSPRPGAWCRITFKGQLKRLKITRSRILNGLFGPSGKTIRYDQKSWIIACGQDALELLEVQLEGKSRMIIKDFLMGHTQIPHLSENMTTPSPKGEGFST